jgi:hypothetical protein
MGRTGRKRQGRVIFLLTQGKEVRDHQKSQNTYEEIQMAISSGRRFTYRLDESLRILPEAYTPSCVKRTIQPPKETLDALTIKVDKYKKMPKKERNRSLPENAQTGFTTASKIMGKRKRESPSNSDSDEISLPFVHPDTLTSPFLSKSDEEKARRKRTKVVPTSERMKVHENTITSSIPAGSLRNRLNRTRENIKDKSRSTREVIDLDLDEFDSTPPNLFASSPKQRLSERSPNVPAETFDIWASDSSDDDFANFSFGVPKKGNGATDDKTSAMHSDNMIQFPFTPKKSGKEEVKTPPSSSRKHIRIAMSSDED